MGSYFSSAVVYCHFATKPLHEIRFMYAATLTFSLSQVHHLILIVGIVHLSRKSIESTTTVYNVNITVGTYSLPNDITEVKLFFFCKLKAISSLFMSAVLSIRTTPLVGICGHFVVVTNHTVDGSTACTDSSLDMAVFAWVPYTIYFDF